MTSLPYHYSSPLVCDRFTRQIGPRVISSTDSLRAVRGLPSEQESRSISDREQRWRTDLGGVANGDPQALSRLYDECAATLLGLARRIVKNDADAEEIILDVFEQVWRTAHTFDPTRGNVWRWLTLLVRSRAIDRLRTAASKHDRDILSLTETWNLASHEPPPDRATMFCQAIPNPGLCRIDLADVVLALSSRLTPPMDSA